MDRSFANCLSEIEKSYLVLPKAARIRVERWVEKLVSTGNNATWKKHRNEYARLLLNMVIARNLEAPFHVMPPEGPIAPFTSQFRAFNKNTLGPHESSFWRDLYQQLGDHPNVNAQDEDKGEVSFQDNRRDRVGEAIASKVQGAVKACSSSANNQVILSREVQSLNLLIREQGHKIKLLEQQLHDERTQHELQLQRLHYSNRVEVNNLKKQIEDFAVELSVQELSPSRRATSHYLNTSMNSQFLNTNSAGAYIPQYGVRLGPTFDIHQTAPPPPGTPGRRVPTSPVRSATAERHGMLSFMEQKNNVTSVLNGVSVMEPDSFDLTPRPKAAPRPLAQPHTQSFPNSFAPAPTEHHEVAYGADESRFGSPGGLDGSMHWGGGRQHSHVGDQEDEAFLAHIDRFQSEIKKINTNITLTSPERF